MKNASILIVEDDTSTANFFKLLLTNSGYTVIGVVSTGEKAIDLAVNTNPDLILMDIVLKGKIDGIMAYEQIKKAVDIPVIYVSGYTQKDMIDRAMQTEPGDYIVKPFKIKVLLSKVKSVLELSQVLVK